MFELIKNSVNLVAHVEQYTKLHHTGRIHQGLCCLPGHPDKATPSLTVYADDNSFFCFGCNRGGSVIDFESYMQEVTPYESAVWLCEKYGLKPSFIDTLKYQQRLTLRKKKDEWMTSLDGSFEKKPDILKYIKERGLSEDTIKAFALGAGDTTNVVVMPIRDKFGRAVGFARRNLDYGKPGCDSPKYINDNSDAIYNKSEILYNLDQAKFEIRERQSVILNEGYFDTMSLWEVGLKQCVAFCSSRITRDQVKVLSDMLSEDAVIYFVPTNDLTAQEQLEKNVAQVKLLCPRNHRRALIIPGDCKDLNDVLMRYGKLKVTELFAQSVSVEHYLLLKLLENEPVPEKQYTKVRNLCTRVVDDTMILEDMCKFLASKWERSVDSVRGYLTSKKKDEIDLNRYKTLPTLVQEYDNYVTTIKDNRLQFGWRKTDMITRGMRPGDVVTMVASTGVGKTAWAQNLLINLTKQYPDLPMLFYSLEQVGFMAFERFVMMEGSMEAKDVEAWHMNPDKVVQGRLIEAMTNLSKNFKNFALVEEGGMTLEKVEKYTLDAGMALFKRPVKVIVIDYLGYLHGDGKDLYHQVTGISKEVKQMAKRLGAIVVLLCQVSKVGKTGGDPIEGYMARDSGVVQESADIMISAWRPEMKEGLSDDEKRLLDGVYMTKIVKNRYGSVGIKIEFFFTKIHLKLLEKRDDLVTLDEHGKITFSK